MPELDQRPKVTIEDLLRLKRAERPAAEFWTNFVRELRQKQLTALLEKRPWWQELPQILARRAYLPVGATAIGKQIQLFGDGVRGTDRNDEPFAALFDQVRAGGVGGGNDRQPLRHGLEQHQPEALEERGENEDVLAGHLAQHFGVRQGADPAMAPERFVQGRAIFGYFAPEQGQFHAVAEEVHGLQKIGEPLALAERAGKKDPQPRTARRGLGAGHGGWGTVGDDVDRRLHLGRRLDGFFREAARHDDGVGERELLVFARELRGAVAHPGEGAGPWRFALGFLGVDGVRGAPVADRQVVEAFDPTRPRGGESGRGAVLVGVNPGQTGDLAEPARDPPIEAAKDRVDAARTGLVPAERLPSKTTGEHPARP